MNDLVFVSHGTAPLLDLDILPSKPKHHSLSISMNVSSQFSCPQTKVSQVYALPLK